MSVYSDRAGYLFSAASAEATGTTAIDLRGTNGHFYLYVSASSNGPTAQASAQFLLQHSPDLTGWLTLQLLTASAGTAGSNQAAGTFHSAGVYGYVRGVMPKVYSAAQTGTGVIYAYVLPGAGG